MTRLASLFSVAWLCLWPVARVSAQRATVESPAHISVVDGRAVLERDGRTETAPLSMPLLAGDRVRTESGRVEVLFADGSSLHLDTNTVVDFQSDEVIRLLDGRVRLNITGANRAVEYRIDAPAAWVQITQPGEYRVAVLRGQREPEVELAVLRGSAELVNEDGRTPLRAGERAFARAGAAPSYAYVFNSAAWDAFDQWSEARRDERLGVSAQYLPDQVRPYAGTFDRYGSWSYMADYGYVWYPTVRVGWRPYYYGRWAGLRPFGWTWIGTDPWGWPTHHYGRWGFSAGLWFWIPGRHWGPAWVSWAYAPGYVSWCPLGWDNRAVIQFVNVNMYAGRRYNPWSAWTVVPYRHFGRSYVNVSVVGGAGIDSRIRSSFVVRNAAPDIRGYAVPRSAAPIGIAGTRAVTVSPAGGVRSAPTGDATSPRSRSRSAAPGGSAGGSDNAAAAFRNRRSGTAVPVGPGYPQPSREPRAISTPSNSSRSAPSRRERPVSGDVLSDVERRAVPRERGNAAAPTIESVPRRSVPGYRTAPSPMTRPPGGFRESSAPESPDQHRAVPRAYDGAYAPREVSPPDRGRRSEDPGGWGGTRAIPRSAPGAAPPPAYRPGPGVERRAPAEARPSGPPPAAAPTQPSGPPPAAAAPGRSSGGAEGGRSRGGAPSSGSAVRRPGGGR